MRENHREGGGRENIRGNSLGTSPGDRSVNVNTYTYAMIRNTHIHASVHMHTYMCMCAYVYLHTHIYTHIYVCIGHPSRGSATLPNPTRPNAQPENSKTERAPVHCRAIYGAALLATGVITLLPRARGLN